MDKYNKILIDVEEIEQELEDIRLSVIYEKDNGKANIHNALTKMRSIMEKITTRLAK